MSSSELACTRVNWNRQILEGRKPGLTLGIGCETAQFPLPQVGKDLFRDLKRSRETLDSINGEAKRIRKCVMNWSPASIIPGSDFLCPYLTFMD